MLKEKKFNLKKQRKKMSQYGLTHKPRDHGYVIEITQQKGNEKKKHIEKFQINQKLKDEIEINQF